MAIKNIVFDVGNVLVKWDPAGIIMHLFPESPNQQLLIQQIFKSHLWYNLNLGKLSFKETLDYYHQSFGIDPGKLKQLMLAIQRSLLPIDDSFDLLKKCHRAQYDLYALTDNVHEIVAFLRSTYDFWDVFLGTVISAEVGFLKPSPEIYLYLLHEFNLIPEETLFIDDTLVNVEGAKLQGIHAIHFVNVKQCLAEMREHLILI